MKIKILIVDDHMIFRAGLKLMLSTISGVEVVAEASDGAEFLSILPTIEADIVFMDINMKGIDGIEASTRALELYPDLKIIILTSYEDEEYFNKLTDIGIKAYLLKNTSKVDFEKAINKVYSGSMYFSDDLIARLTKRMQNFEQSKKKENEQIQFNEEETNLLQLICKGFTNKEIADKLCLSARTIEAHRAKLLDKTDTKNSVSLAVYAIVNKIIKYE